MKKNTQENNHMTGKTEVARSLKTRHLSMIALGGSIGTGLFVASGSTISTAGPGGALLAYLLIGMMVFFLMTSLGEMATFMPVSGSFSVYADKFVDPAVGFALGWNYWFNWAITLAVDLSTAGIVVHFWLPQIPAWLISLFALIAIFMINIISVKSFAETEYWLSLIKVITVLLFLLVGSILIFYGLNGHAPIFLENYLPKNSPFKGGLPAVFSAFVIAGFSFQGTELVGITAGESETPEKSIPKAIKQVFFRILIFYIFAIFVIGALIPSNSPQLLGSGVGDVAISPFTLVFKSAGLKAAADIINGVILISVLSAANSGMYASTRMLWSLGSGDFAPKIFSKTNNRGIPLPALLLTTFIGLAVLLLSIFGNQVYLLLVTASGLTGFIAWLGIAISHYRFRKAMLIHDPSLSRLKYRAPFYPIGPILALIMSIAVIIGQDMKLYTHFNLLDFAVSYISIPIFLGTYLYYKIKHKTHIVDLKTIDIDELVKHHK